MVEITVGQVAGIIAALIVAVQLLSPLIIAFLIAGYLRDSETASTWTLAAQKLQSSLWPSLLRLDASHQASHGRRAIRILAAAMPIVALLTAIAGIVTPLGLGEDLHPSSQTSASFEYARDPSAFLAGTTPRGRHDFSRLCRHDRSLFSVPAPCPYTGDRVDVEADDAGVDAAWDNLSTNIPNIIREIFSSGTARKGSTVANFFDIEWRQYTSTVEDKKNNGNPYGIGVFRQLESFILENEYVLVEGLIVDAKVGGIGLRNHTVPMGMSRGATWDEDILFIEPDAACINTNLTIDFTIRYNLTNQSTNVADLRLVDQGGFVNLNTTYPELEEDNRQENPDLYKRAMRGAYLNNAYTMLVYNITNPNDEGEAGTGFDYINSEIGKDFPLVALAGDGYQALGMSDKFANYLHFEQLNSSLFDVPDYSNPFNITKADLDGISISCSGAGSDDASTLSNIYLACGLIRGAPIRQGEGPDALLEHESRWSSPLHSCATTVRATIKTVTFSFNATGNPGLEGLRVTSIKDKEYANDEDMPLWGFEESGLTVAGIAATWGLISSEYESHDNVSSLRAPHLNLPGDFGVMAQSLRVGSWQNYPGSEFPSRAMNTVFELDDDWPFDLLGHASMAIFTRWQELSKDPTKASEIIKLLWTDIAASGIVGTKGVLGTLNEKDAGDSSNVKIRPIDHSITYNYLYGIPAFVLALSLIVFLIILSLSVCFGKGSIGKLRLRLQQLSPGRIFTSFLYSDASNLTMRSADWARANGIKNITLGVFAERSMKPMQLLATGSPQVETKKA